jgi:hypothetical protein
LRFYQNQCFEDNPKNPKKEYIQMSLPGATT